MALESHKTHQLNAIRTLMEKQLDILRHAKLDLSTILSQETQISPKNVSFPYKQSIYTDEEYRASFGSNGVQPTEDSGKAVS